MVIYERERVFQNMDHVGKAIYYHLCFFSTSERALGGWVDSTVEGSEARVPLAPLLFVLAMDAFRHVYHASVLTKTVERILDSELSRWYSCYNMQMTLCFSSKGQCKRRGSCPFC